MRRRNRNGQPVGHPPVARRERGERSGVRERPGGPAADTLTAELAGRSRTCGCTGAAVTSFVLSGIERQTAGASVPANLALAENNARVAAAVAAALTQ